jgi:hypothetical protein
MLHIILFYPANVGFLFGVLYGCKVLNGIKHSVVTNISIGTLVIVGLHIVAVTVVNFTLDHLHHLNDTIYYKWFEALPTTLIIVSIIYLIILWTMSYAPILLGRKSTNDHL